MKLETFDDVLASIKKNKTRKCHLLLGNGFSIAYDATIFSYNALHDFIVKLDDKDLSTILNVIETKNFEVISNRMENGEYPIFVTAGNGLQKLTHTHITHNQYLTYCYDNFCEADGSLVTFGFNFGPQDEHIIDAINRAAKRSPSEKLWSVYIGVYSEEDKKHVELAGKFKCKVHMYDATTANVWG